MIKRLAILVAIVLCGLATLSAPASARYWRGGGWGGYPYGWGWGGWPGYLDNGPYGYGYYNPNAVYYVPPPPRPDPAYVRLWDKCPAGRRIPAHWVKVKSRDGQTVLNHVMGRCR